MEGTSSLLLLLATGVLILRPRDIPVMARVMGRAVGGAVRSLRFVKETAEEAMVENMKRGKHSNPEMQIVGRGLRDSLSKFDSVAATLRRDMADVPISPRMWIQKGMRSFDKAAETGHPEEGEQSVSSQTPARETKAPDKRWSESNHDMQPPVLRKSIHLDPKTNSSSGVDFIARAIEEAALAQQQQKIFAGSFAGSKQDTAQPNDN